LSQAAARLALVIRSVLLMDISSSRHNQSIGQSIAQSIGHGNGHYGAGLFPIILQLGEKRISTRLSLNGVPWGYAPESPRYIEGTVGMVLASVVSIPATQRTLKSLSVSDSALTLEGVVAENFLLVVTNQTAYSAKFALPFLVDSGFVNTISQSHQGLLKQEATELPSDFSLTVEPGSTAIAFLKVESKESFSGNNDQIEEFLNGIELYQNALLSTGDTSLKALVYELLKAGSIGSLPPAFDITPWLEGYLDQVETGVRSLNDALWHKKASYQRGLEVLNGGIAKTLSELSATRLKLHDRMENNFPLGSDAKVCREAAGLAIGKLKGFSFNAAVFAPTEIADPWLEDAEANP
jgi:hypothetical protein